MPVGLSSLPSASSTRVFGATGQREDPEPDGEDELEQEAREEHGRGVGEDREDPQHGVGRAVLEVGGDEAERDADDEGDDERVDDQLERCRAVLQQHLADEPVVGERAAEVPRGDLAEVLEVLHDDRPVEAGGRQALLELLRGEAVAHGGGDRVAHDAHEEEDQRHEDEHGRDDEHGADEDVLAEPDPLLPGLGLLRPGGRGRGHGVRDDGHGGWAFRVDVRVVRLVGCHDGWHGDGASRRSGTPHPWRSSV